MNNPFCNPFSDSTHLSLVKSRIYSEEGLTSSQHASLLSLESLVPRLQSTNQSIFSRKLAFLVVSVYHNYLLSPPSCLGMTPLCWGRSRASQPPFLERLRVETSQEQKQIKSRMNFLAPPITTQPSRSCDNTLGIHWTYTNKNNKRSLFARTMQQRASFNNDESSPQTQLPSLKAFHHSLDDGYGGAHQSKKVHVTNLRSESSNLLESPTATSIMPQTASRESYTAAPALITTSRGANAISGNSAHTIISSKYYISYYHIFKN